jgi:ankyrin repeat protein
MRTIISALLLITGSVYAADSAVADAAQRRDIAAVRSALSQHASVNAAQPDGTTALHWAAHWNDLEMVKFLLGAGANPNAVNRFTATPLSEAAQAGGSQIAEALLNAGADPKTLTTLDGETVLMTAARAGNLETVKLLIARGADVNAHENYRGQTALMWAAAERHPEVVKYLLDHGADWKVRSFERDNKLPKLSAASSVTPMARGGLAALHFAAREGDVESARSLLDAGADINEGDADATPPLTVALMNKQYSFAKFLLDRGANPNVNDVRGRSPLYASIDARNEDYSALPSRKASDPLPDIEIIRALLDKGADPNAALTKNLPGRSGMDSGDTSLDQGATPLMRAARAGDVEVMRMLAAKGADPKLETHLGNNALLFAAGVGYRDKNTHGDEAGALESVKFALSLGLDLNHKNNRGETALHGAAFRGADSIAKYLVEQGAKIDERTNQGLTTLDYAMGKSVTSQLPVPHDSTVELLRKLGGHEGTSLPPLQPKAPAR